MRVITIKPLRAFWQRYRDAQKPLENWFRTTEASDWRDFMELRRTFGHADTAKVASGHTVTIFDIAGNKYRLVTAIHYNTGVVYAMMVLTHQEYDKQKWKDLL